MIKRDKYDRVFSDLIRERDDYRCMLRVSNDCLISSPDRGGREWQCCHYISRGNASVRYDPSNALCGCGSCHSMIDRYSWEKEKVWRRFLGDVLLEELQRKGRQPKRWRKHDKEQMYQHYTLELKRLQVMRESGETGVIEVISWE